MKKQYKLIISLLVMLLLVSTFTLADVQAKGKKTSKTSCSYTLKNGTLTISGKGVMKVEGSWKNNKKIKKVVIKKGITEIPADSFSGCKNLKAVSIPATVKKIGTNAFLKTSLKKVTIPNSVKSIGEGAFYTKKVMSEIKLPGNFTVERISGFETETGYSSSLITTFRAKKVEFTNAIKDSVNQLNFGNLLYFDNTVTDFSVSKSDKKYASENGIIYTKDFKKVVRIPNRKVVKIKEGCEEFDLHALFYGEFLDDGGAEYGEDAYRLVNTKVQKLVLPTSLKKIVDSVDYRESASYKQPLKKITILSNKIYEDSMNVLKNELKAHKNKGQNVKIVMLCSK